MKYLCQLIIVTVFITSYGTTGFASPEQEKYEEYKSQFFLGWEANWKTFQGIMYGGCVREIEGDSYDAFTAYSISFIEDYKLYFTVVEERVPTYTWTQDEVLQLGKKLIEERNSEPMWGVPNLRSAKDNLNPEKRLYLDYSIVQDNPFDDVFFVWVSKWEDGTPQGDYFCKLYKVF